MRTPAVVCLIGLLASMPALWACATFEVAADADETEASKNAYETVHGSFYGFRWDGYHAQKCDDGPLAKVEFHYNGLQFLASLLSLGFYVPQTVEWWCADASTVDDSDEPGLDPAGESGARRTRGAR